MGIQVVLGSLGCVWFLVLRAQEPASAQPVFAWETSAPGRGSEGGRRAHALGACTLSKRHWPYFVPPSFPIALSGEVWALPVPC